MRSGRDIDRLVSTRWKTTWPAIFPQAEPRVRRFGLRPTSRSTKIEARFSSPDPAVLRKLADEAKSILRSDPQTRSVGDDWRQPVKTCVPVYSQAGAAIPGLARGDGPFAPPRPRAACR